MNESCRTDHFYLPWKKAECKLGPSYHAAGPRARRLQGPLFYYGAIKQVLE